MIKVFQNFSTYLLATVFISFFLAGCSNSYIEDVKRGGDYAYQPGFPELRIEIAGFITPEGQSKIKIAGTIPHNSLIFKQRDGELIADVSLLFEIRNTTVDQVRSSTFEIDVTKDLNSSVFSNDLYMFEREFDAQPGEYIVAVSATDKSSKKSTVRKAEAFIPNTNNNVTNITNIRLLSKHEDNSRGFFPVTTYDVSSAADSLRFEFQVTNSDPEKSINFQARLLKFNADTTVGLPMSFTNPSASSIEHKGIDYRDFEIIQSTQRQINRPGNVTVEFVFKNLDRGNYRFEVGTALPEKGPLYKARDFSIKSENYPSVKTPRELAAPLVYLMKDKDHEKMMAIQSDDSLKAAIDRFWLENIQNAALAKNVISLYYQRVEEANKLFSNFKEGWKTDRGMIYILFGPPLDTYQRLRTVRWSYKFNEEDPEYTYYFRSSKTKTDFYPFDHYVLQRNNMYFRIEYRIRELWLSGNIISRNI